jgi:uncharacterized protein (TIGR03083 family)
MTESLDIARLYQDVVASAIELFESLSDDEWASPVPCSPQWSIRDVLSHTSGVADDITNGRVEGSGTDPWTAAQVERYRHDDPKMLLARWREQAEPVGKLLATIEEGRPVFDCHTHEHDLRQALGRPANRDSEVIAIGSSLMVGTLLQASPVTVTFDDGTSLGDGAASVSGLSRFELFRSRLGRRSANQLDGYNWAGPADEVAAVKGAWFAFGPSADDIHE